jgi:pyruvate dehydrogenase E1 component
VRLVASGPIVREALAAADALAREWSVSTEVWSATSFSELARDAIDCERWNRLHPTTTPRVPHVAAALAGDAPVIAASDNVRAWPQLIAPHCGAPFCALGTDGFGRSDTRAELRAFFEVDRQHIAVAALHALARQGRVDVSVVARAIERHGLSADAPPPWTR